MSASMIYETAPLGSLIMYSDGTKRPPERFRRKLAVWKQSNGVGRLTKKRPPRFQSPATITLHEGDVSDSSVIVMVVTRTFSVDSTLTSQIVSQPPVGSVRILQDLAGGSELAHLAESQAAAELWMAKHRRVSVRLEEVTIDDTALAALESAAA